MNKQIKQAILDKIDKKNVKIKQKKWENYETLKHKIIALAAMFFLAFVPDKSFSDYATTMDKTVYMPFKPDYNDPWHMALIYHELQHVEQYEQHGWWFELSYLLVLPTWYTYRAVWEYEAYMKHQMVGCYLSGEDIEEEFNDRVRWVVSAMLSYGQMVAPWLREKLTRKVGNDFRRVDVWWDDEEKDFVFQNEARLKPSFPLVS